VISPAVDELAGQVGIVKACALLGRSWAGHYRSRRPLRMGPRRPRPAAVNALTEAERSKVLGVLTSDRFVDKSVAQMWATLLDEGTTCVRCRRCAGSFEPITLRGERRSQATHPARAIPELVATRPGQVWT